MASPRDVARFHAEYDQHPDDRIHLFSAISDFLGESHGTGRVLYPGSYVDIAPSVFFDDVFYVDTDRRAARFFAEEAAVSELVAAKRRQIGRLEAGTSIRFEQMDYRDGIGIGDGSVDLLVSLYAGFVSESCTRYLAAGGHLFVNNSHGDASMASLDPGYGLAAVVTSREGRYHVTSADLGRYLIPKAGSPPTVDDLHASGRGIGYTTSPYAYVFRRAAKS